MSAVEVLRLAQENGIRLGVAGDDLILDAEREPAPDVLEAIKHHKEGIVALLVADHDEWSAEDWQAFYDERAGIAEFDGGQSRAEAEAIAFESCVVEWMNRHPCRTDPGRCAACGEPDREGHKVAYSPTRRGDGEHVSKAVHIGNLHGGSGCFGGVRVPNDAGERPRPRPGGSRPRRSDKRNR